MTHNHNSSVTLPAFSAGCQVQNYVKCIIVISNKKKKLTGAKTGILKLTFFSFYPCFLLSLCFLIIMSYIILFSLQNMLLTVRRYFEMLKF